MPSVRQIYVSFKYVPADGGIIAVFRVDVPMSGKNMFPDPRVEFCQVFYKRFDGQPQIGGMKGAGKGIAGQGQPRRNQIDGGFPDHA